MDDSVTTPAHGAYATRKSVLEPETVWRLTPDALVRERIGEEPHGAGRKLVEIGYRILFPWGRPLTYDNWPDRVPYSEISSIRVRYDPTRFDRVRDRCDLVGPGGARVSLYSTRYKSPGNFKDQAATYKPFINELTRHVLAARPEAPVYSGLTWRSYIIQHGFLLATFVALFAILMATGLPVFGLVWVKFIIVLTYLGTAVAYALRNIPRKLNPPKR